MENFSRLFPCPNGLVICRYPDDELVEIRKLSGKCQSGYSRKGYGAVALINYF